MVFILKSQLGVSEYGLQPGYRLDNKIVKDLGEIMPA